jgi:hypothetical protein
MGKKSWFLITGAALNGITRSAATAAIPNGTKQDKRNTKCPTAVRRPHRRHSSHAPSMPSVIRISQQTTGTRTVRTGL